MIEFTRYIFVLNIILFNICTGEYVPVLTWGTNKGNNIGNQYSALERLDSDQLHDFVKKTTLNSLKPLVLVFTEEHLSVEDFSWHDIEENTVFTQLQNVTSSADFINFFPSVHAPLKGFKDFVKDGFKQQGIHLGKQSIDSLKLSEKNGNVVIIKLDDAHQTEDRPDLLRRHDKIISDTYTHFVDKGFQVTALYTGRHTSWVEPEVLPANRRIRRLLADEGEENTTTVWSTTPPTIILYSSSIPYITDAADGLGAIILNLTSYDSIIDDTGRNDTSRLILTFGGGIVLRFYFPVVGGYWSLPYVEMSNSTGTVEFLLNTTSDIVAPYNFSYHCAQEIIFSNTTMQRSIVFQGLQVQPYQQSTNIVFGDAYDCVWFFTGAIWSGLFVTLLLALIMSWGLSMILDIKTMDQFDDPKGKTITVNATD